MRTPRSSAEHQEAVSRRLALLSAELGSVTGGRDGVEPGGRESAQDLPAEVGQVAGSQIPTPGRHASRRRQASTGGPAPGSVLARMSLGAAQLSVLAVALALGLAVTGWWLLRSTPSEVPPSASGPAVELVTPVGATDRPAPSGSPVTLVVDVAGKVRRPGIAVLDPGARVVDAIQAAGGARPGVDLSSLNLARVLVDGEQILVGVPAPQGVAATATGAGPTSAPWSTSTRPTRSSSRRCRRWARSRPRRSSAGATSTVASRRSTSCSTSTASARPP